MNQRVPIHEMEAVAQPVNRAEAREIIDRIRKNPERRLFSVEFIKRSGGLRKMVCRMGVRKGLKYGRKTHRPDHELLDVFCPLEKDPKRQRRCIPLEGILRLTVDGQQYEVSENLALLAPARPISLPARKPAGHPARGARKARAQRKRKGRKK